MLKRPPRQQYAALCYRFEMMNGISVPRVLLLTSRETGRWVIPKGWPMKGKRSCAVAAQEAYEEAGVQGNVHKEVFGFYAYLKKRKSGVKVPVKVQVHLLEVTGMLESFPEKESRKLEWVSCEEAAVRVNEPELKGLLLAFAQKMQAPPVKQFRATGS
ncbi:NUDIX hydrolase [Rhizobium oryzicola]|uniref:NUDIX hydrolase n=1 Tax=Rhizobium oryzicola TaxID=1232668 RepID=A0ABT8SRW3_9HYPH|nr:NUDIX hydrolase [Rhizobium oryzicola]MDO1581141.1 NUDIX hydrolase [Rhizobium oryzicola]